MATLLDFVVPLLLFSFTFVFFIVFVMVYLGREKSKVLHQLSDGTFAMASGSVDKNKLFVKKLKFDLEDIKVYIIRTLFGYKPLYITSWGRSKPLQIKEGYLEAEKLTPDQIKSMGELESLKQLFTAKVRSAGGMNRITVIFSVMAFVMGTLLGYIIKMAG